MPQVKIGKPDFYPIAQWNPSDPARQILIYSRDKDPRQQLIGEKSIPSGQAQMGFRPTRTGRDEKPEERREASARHSARL